MATNRKISVLMILFLFCFAICKSQTNSINMPNDTIAFSIQVKDRWEREVGYFRYNQNTNRLLVRGNQNKVWAHFVNTFLKQMYEIYQAQQELFKYFDENGCVTDQEKFDEAMRNYMAVKRKYRM